MKPDVITPLWSRFHRAAFPISQDCSLDELRRLVVSSRYWHDDVCRALAKREARYGRRRAPLNTEETAA